LWLWELTARKRMRIEGGCYRRDYLRALAQRVEVDARTSHHGLEKRTAAYARRRFKRKNGGVWRAQFCTEVAHPTRFERVVSTFGGQRPAFGNSRGPLLFPRMPTMWEARPVVIEPPMETAETRGEVTVPPQFRAQDAEGQTGSMIFGAVPSFSYRLHPRLQRVGPGALWCVPRHRFCHSALAIPTVE
jgi:hypothetical protein